MNQRKKLVAVILCFAMLMSLLSGCKKNVADTNTSTDTSTTTDTSADVTEGEELVINYDEHVEYDFWMPSTSASAVYESYGDNPVVDYLEKKFNVTFNFEQPASGTESDALSIMLGTGEYPDIMNTSYYTGSISQLYDDSVIIDLTEKVEKYMPNYMALINSDPYIARNLYNDDHQILNLVQLLNKEDLMWGGFAYRRDILDTMTGNNVFFPSGNADPTTVEDWDYMLPLIKQYFDAAGLAESAPLIIPYNGYFVTGELVSGFGAAGSYFLDETGTTVKYGPTEDGFYNYLAKMKEWYAAGYIYQDFASRTTDLFYIPNTALTYGGAAGIWFGLSSQLGTAMSLPDYGLNVVVKAMSSPIDAANGVQSASVHLKNDVVTYGGFVITDKCENVERLLEILDFCYSEEGSYLIAYGLDAEHGAADNSYYQEWGMTDGAFTRLEDGTVTKHEKMKVGGELYSNTEAAIGQRIPGSKNVNGDLTEVNPDQIAADAQWMLYDPTGNLPLHLTKTSEEDAIYVGNQTNIDDYINAEIPKFIMGITDLTPETWAAYKAQIVDFGLEENLGIQQASLDRYNAR